MANEQCLNIECSFLGNPDKCIFNIGVRDSVQEIGVFLNPENICSCVDLKHDLLKIFGVKEVVISRLNKVEVTKDPSVKWFQISSKIEEVIRQHVE